MHQVLYHRKPVLLPWEWPREMWCSWLAACRSSNRSNRPICIDDVPRPSVASSTCPDLISSRRRRFLQTSKSRTFRPTDGFVLLWWVPEWYMIRWTRCRMRVFCLNSKTSWIRSRTFKAWLGSITQQGLCSVTINWWRKRKGCQTRSTEWHEVALTARKTALDPASTGLDGRRIWLDGQNID